MGLPSLVARSAAALAMVSAMLLAACTSPAPGAAPPATSTTTPLTDTPASAPAATAVPSAAAAAATAAPPTPTARPAGSGSNTTTTGYPAEVVRGDASKPMVALTFDSGSVVGETAKILDILARNQVRSSWFVTGQFAEKNPALVKRAAQDGHEVFNHSYSHPDLTTLPDAEIIKEMTRAEEILKNVTGKVPKPYMRMPFGARNPRVLKLVGDLGYRSIYWTLDSADWREGWTADMVRDRVLNNAGNGYIVVHHSSPAATSGSLETIVKTLKERGFQLVTVSTLLGQQGDAAVRTTTPDQAPDGDDLLALVNKQLRLPDGYVPGDLKDLTAAGVPTLYKGLLLREVAIPALSRLVAAAKGDGVDITVLSGYRSYQDQEGIYQRAVAAQGKTAAERVVAIPGHSQHQLGTTVDFTAKSVNFDLTEAFGDTNEGRWLAANAPRFGYVLSYPKGKETVTGYAYEPWHLRFIGETAAADLVRQGVLLEEYLAAHR